MWFVVIVFYLTSLWVYLEHWYLLLIVLQIWYFLCFMLNSSIYLSVHTLTFAILELLLDIYHQFLLWLYASSNEGSYFHFRRWRVLIWECHFHWAIAAFEVGFTRNRFPFSYYQLSSSPIPSEVIFVILIHFYKNQSYFPKL